ncbi:hypothetical protein B0T20DRAFT_343898 [Sordaria brevicollis]|uniref:Rhodopsin domain-containing protein n=1 Tax=Sordaria brevicollis TaxID=83679 RepID=A0AAE0UFU3_SORBR|nr:hypothetical protein B0T20DRAFT_343898 [Sordaria brevicollis]
MDLPPPPPEDIRRQNGLIISSAVMIAVAMLFVLLRCVSRFILIRNPGLDDYFIVAAMALTLGYLINLVILTHNGIGMPISTLTLENMVNFLKITLAIQVMYYANVFCIKVSILFTYLRFAVTKTFRNLCYGTIILHVVFLIVCIIVTLAQCQPLHKMWDFTNSVDGQCINTTAFFYFTSAFNILTDLFILLLPITTLQSINRPTREKIALFIIFGVGTFAAVASIVRLHTIYIYTLAEDPFHEGIKVNLWSVIEVTIAIACASVSALKPIFSGRQRMLTRGARSGGGGGGGGYKGYGGYGKGTYGTGSGTGTGSGMGSRSVGGGGRFGTKKKGSVSGLGSTEFGGSEDGLHGYGGEEHEEAELQKMESREERLSEVDLGGDHHRAGLAGGKGREGEFTQGHEGYRRWVSSSSHGQDGEQHCQHGRQPSNPNTGNQIQRPKPAATAVSINQTRALSPPPPQGQLSPRGNYMPGQQQQPTPYNGHGHEAKATSGGGGNQPGRWVEVETADTRTVFTQGGEVKITPLYRPGPGGGSRTRGLSEGGQGGQGQIWAGQEIRQEVTTTRQGQGMNRRNSSSDESMFVLQK